MTAAVFLLLGTNSGDRKKNLDTALRFIAGEAGTISRKSSVYETDAWGITEQPAFYNQVAEIKTPMTAHSLLTTILSIEKKMGRVRREKWGERIIDIDILFFGSEVVNSDELTIPHPQLAFRKFTLVPLCELIPDFIHPVLHQTTAELLSSCTDELDVRKLT